jgi:diguanylate cyclase (GGDEF)-like protein
LFGLQKWIGGITHIKSRAGGGFGEGSLVFLLGTRVSGMRIAASRFPLNVPSPTRGDDLRARMAAMAEELTGLREIVDVLNVGIVVLDKEGRVKFMNRAFRYFWRVPNKMVMSDLTFAQLMRHGRGMRAYAMTHERAEDYLGKQMELIRSGEDRPLQMRLTNGGMIQFRCKTLPRGGHLLSYGNVSELAKEAAALERLASLDSLTGLNNRRHFMVLAEMEWSRFKRYGRPLAMLMLDIDFFKSVNDCYGHDAGDEVIKAVANILQKHKRTSDIVGRLGGEEFALLLPEASSESAAAAGERLRRVVAESEILTGDERIPATISVGVAASYDQTNGIGQMLKEADIALYEAKRTGRNRVCRFEPKSN